jgi:uncharacterized protein (TIGR02001 family)
MRSARLSPLLACVWALPAILAPAAWGQEADADDGDITLAASVAVVTDYRFRGWSLSGSEPALQIDANATHVSGFYAGAFASSIEEFEDTQSGERASVELDLYAGWNGEALGWQVDVGAQLYTYPGAESSNYFVLPISLTRSIGALDLTVGYELSPAQDALGDETSTYTWLGAEWAPSFWPVSFLSSIGFEDGAMAVGGKLDWAVSAYIPAGSFELGLGYVDSDEASAGSALIGELRAHF